jgi:hypothetical protein
MDPASAIAIATTSFSVIKKGFSLSKDVYSMTQDIGKFMDAIDNINNTHKEEKKKKYGSVSEEALETYAAKKKAEAMQNELRNFLIGTYGMNAWNDVLRIQAQIRKARIAEKERKAKQLKLIAEILIGTIIGLIGFAMLLAFAMYLKG